MCTIIAIIAAANRMTVIAASAVSYMIIPVVTVGVFNFIIRIATDATKFTKVVAVDICRTTMVVATDFYGSITVITVDICRIIITIFLIVSLAILILKATSNILISYTFQHHWLNDYALRSVDKLQQRYQLSWRVLFLHVHF